MIKPKLKYFFHICSLILVSPLIIVSHVFFLIGSDSFYYSCANMLSLIPGLIGSYIRVAFYKGTIKKISSTCYIGFGSFISKRDAQLGVGVTVGAYSIIGKAVIGDNVLIASRVSLLSGKYQHGDSKGISASDEGNRYDTISIGKNTWIGEGAIVASDVGEGCIVAFGATVNRNIPNNYIVAGNPGKPIKR